MMFHVQVGRNGGDWRGAETCDAAQAVFGEEEYFECRRRLDKLSEQELSRFRAAPENQMILRQFDQYARRQVLPYALVLGLVFSISIAAAIIARA